MASDASLSIVPFMAHLDEVWSGISQAAEAPVAVAHPGSEAAISINHGRPLQKPLLPNFVVGLKFQSSKYSVY
jgi:hypothetical protein